MSSSQQFTASPAEPSVERVATVTLRLAVENNSKFVRGRKRAKENIERYCLEPYGMKQLESGNYELTIRLTNSLTHSNTLQTMAFRGISEAAYGAV